jgi:hypothetical protein
LRRNLKGETKSAITAAHHQALETKYSVTKILQRAANADCANNLMIQQNTSYKHAQYWLRTIHTEI